MKKIACLFVILALAGGLFSCTPAQVQGGGVGAAAGGIAGALLDHRNPWRGGLIGAALGGVFGATLGDISDRASREAAAANKPVEYRTENGRGVYYAEPMGYNEQTHCRKIHEKVWEDGRLIRDRVKEICEGERQPYCETVCRERVVPVCRYDYWGARWCHNEIVRDCRRVCN